MTPYDATFFEREATAAGIGAREILPLVFARYAHQDVIDVGCGVGAWCVEAMRLGARYACGIDGEWAEPSRLPGDWLFAARDLSTDPLPHVDADLAICLETAEHLPPARGPSLVRELCMLSPVVLWSAAVPGQGGEGHINERPHAYWEGLFAANGYDLDDFVRPAIAGKLFVPVWYRNNVMVFRREGYR